MTAGARPARVRVAWKVVGWFLVGLVIYLSLTPHPLDFPVDEGDKYEHVLAYGTVMLWFAQAYSGSRRWIVAVALVALGVGLEFVQRWTGYRTFDLWDMAADTAGVILGFVLAPPRLPNALACVEDLISRS